MLKVVHIIPRFYSGGAERLVWQYAKMLPSAELEMHVVSCVEDGELRPLFAGLPVKIFVGSRKKQRGRWGAWQAVNNYLNQVKPNIIHTHLLSPDVIGYFYKRKNPRVKWISTLHNVESFRPWLYQKIWQWIYRRVDKVVAVSEKVDQFVKKDFRVPAEKVIKILNGIDLSRWQGLSNHLFNSQEFQLATIGRLTNQKGHIYLLQALGKIKDLPWQYQVFGDGELEEYLKKQVAVLGIAERIVWRGLVPELEKELINIDVVIQPSLWEGLSLTVMEAMAAGRLVIASRPAGEDLIKNQQTGLLVSAKNVNELAEVLKWVMANKDQAQMMADAGRKYAINNFGLEKNVERLKQVYKEI